MQTGRGGIMHPLDPKMRRPAARQRHGAKFAKSQHGKLYHIPLDIQVLILALAPLWLAVVLFAIAEARP